jgi:hypothetical protein
MVLASGAVFIANKLIQSKGEVSQVEYNTCSGDLYTTL